MTAPASAPQRRSPGPSLRDRIPLLTMLAADALGLIGRGVAVCVLGAILLDGGVDAVLAGATTALVAVVTVARRHRIMRALKRLGMWRSSVVADALGAVGTFAVLLHLDARAEHPLVLVFGVVATGLGIAAGFQLGPRTPVDLARQAQVVPASLSRRWPPVRSVIGGCAMAGGAPATIVLGFEVGWVSFACFVQAAEAVVVLVPYRGAESASPDP